MTIVSHGAFFLTDAGPGNVNGKPLGVSITNGAGEESWTRDDSTVVVRLTA